MAGDHHRFARHPPVFFPGGDIGRLAVSGTVNDLAMMGATEVLGLTCAVIIEEGFAARIWCASSARSATTCAEAGAPIVTGDTKVMGSGELDGIVINTTGVALDRTSRHRLRPAARRSHHCHRHDRRSRHGGHGRAPRTRARGDLRSDVAPLNGLIRAALDAARRRRRRDEGSDARRARLGAARDGGQERRRHRARRARAAGHARRCAPPASCWASIRCTSPTKARRCSACGPTPPRPCSPRCRRIRSARRRDHRHVHRRAPARSFSIRASAGGC